MKTAVVWCVFIIMALSACSPVRTGKQASKAAKGASAPAATESKKSAKRQIASKPRFGDTTLIVMPPVLPSGHSPEGGEDGGTLAAASPDELAEIFESAANEFDKEKYAVSCPKFKMLMETLPENDSLWFESSFYVAECLVTESKVDAAGRILKTLLDAEGLPPDILEKVLVRLGQVYCYQKKHEAAEKLFKRLKEEFPESIYIPVANCESIK